MVQKMIMARHIEVCRRFDIIKITVKFWILLGSELIQYENSTLCGSTHGFANGNTHDARTGCKT